MIPDRHSGVGPEQVLDEVLARYLKAVEAGQAPDRQALLLQYPELAGELAEFFAGLDQLEGLAAPLRAVREPAASPCDAQPVGETVDDVNQTGPQGPAPARPARPPGLPGSIDIPGHEILGVLGRGGMGVVYKARQVKLKRLVALKMIRAGDQAEEADLARFRVEAEAVARLQHPNIVQIYEIGEHNGQPFLSLEFVGGGTLATRLAGTPQPPRQSAELVRTLALAMDVAHQRGIVHRDLKPANVLLAEESTTDDTDDTDKEKKRSSLPSADPCHPCNPWFNSSPKITDFGLAKRLDDVGQTQTGAIVGTPSYMAPEQATGQKQVGPLADVYALGAILYEMLTGRPPFRATTILETLEQVRTQEPVPVRLLQPGVPRDLEVICLKCLEKEPRQRFASAGELGDRLGLFLDGKPIPERPPGWLSKFGRAVRAHPLRTAAAVALVLLAAAAMLANYHLDPERRHKQLRSTLAAGRPYRLKGTERLPGPFRQVFGDPTPLATLPDEDAFSVDASNTVLWQLTDDPMVDHYRFSAELRHDGSGGGPSLVGTYFGYREARPSEGPRRGGFYTLSFADRGGSVRHHPTNPISQVRLEARLFEIRPVCYVPETPISARPFTAAVAPGRTGPWRRLVVVVTPEGIEASWEKAPGDIEHIRRLSAKQVSEALSDLELSIQEMRDVPTDFRPRSGIGLFVKGGKASFRNVTVEPLSGG